MGADTITRNALLPEDSDVWKSAADRQELPAPTAMILDVCHTNAGGHLSDAAAIGNIMRHVKDGTNAGVKAVVLLMDGRDQAKYPYPRAMIRSPQLTVFLSKLFNGDRWVPGGGALGVGPWGWNLA